MSDPSDLAEAVRRAEDVCKNLENRERELSKLAGTGRWETLYGEPEFRALCAENDKELKAGYAALTKAENALWTAAFAIARTPHEAREIKESAAAAADRKRSAQDFAPREAPGEIADRVQPGKEKEDKDMADWVRANQLDEIPGR